MTTQKDITNAVAGLFRATALFSLEQALSDSPESTEGLVQEFSTRIVNPSGRVLFSHTEYVPLDLGGEDAEVGF